LINNVSASTPSYFDAALSQNYYYQVTAVYDVGESGPSNEAFALITNVQENGSDNLPDKFSLSQNYPNPFNPTTTIDFTIPVSAKSQKVRITIYNLLGEKIKTLVDKKHNPGFYSVKWDGRNDLGVHVPSGLYLYQIKSGLFVQVNKMMLIQ